MEKRSYKAKIENIKNTIKNESTTTKNNWHLDKYK
jgi:hypothetical protein